MDTAPKILIADDDPHIQRFVARQLHEAGYATVAVGDGQAALDALAKQEFPIVMLDLEMPVLNGFEVLDALQQNGVAPTAIVLTGMGDVSRAVRALKLGAFDFLEKPCNPQLLAKAVQRALNHRKAQDHSRQMEAIAERWQITFDASPDILIVTDMTGCIVRCNQAAAAVLDTQPGTLVGRNAHEVFCEGGHSSEKCPLAGENASEALLPREYKLRNRWYEVSSEPLRGKDGAIRERMTVARDVTLRRQAERESKSLLRAATAAFESHSFVEAARAIFDACCEATGAKSGYIALLNKDGTENEVLFLEAGGEPCAVDPSLPMPVRGLRAEAYTKAEVVLDNDFMHGPYVQYMPPGHIPLHNVLFAPLNINGNAVGVMGLANKDGDFTQNDAQLAHAFGEMAATVLARTRSEEALRASEEKFRQIVDNIGLGVALVGPAMRIHEMNRQMREWFPDAESTGHPLCDGSINSSPALEPCAAYPTMAALQDGRVHEATASTSQSGESRHYRVVASPIHAGDGTVSAVIEVVEDITERLRLERELNQAQKLEAVGRLAAGIAHEINTPTQYVGDNIEFLQIAYESILEVLTACGKILDVAQTDSISQTALDEARERTEAANLDYLTDQIPKAITQSLEGISRISSIVQAMKEFSHPGTSEKTSVNLNQSIMSTVTVSRNEWKYVAELETDLDESLPLVPCLPGEFNQVILNLIVNAAHAIGDVVGDGASGKGKITISTRQEGPWAVIRVSDTGTGIPDDIRQRIFDPFFTTKGVGRGTGQGLAIARSVVVDKHRGTLSVESDVGKGTTFVIRLPIAPPEPSDSTDDKLGESA